MFILNEDMNYNIIIIIKSLEDSNVLIDGITEKWNSNTLNEKIDDGFFLLC